LIIADGGSLTTRTTK